MVSFKERWNHFWFQPASPANLSLCRMIFFGVALLYSLLTSTEGHFWHADYSAWAQVSKAFWGPTWLFHHFHIPVFSVALIGVLQVVWKLALGLSCIGLWTRLSTAVSFALGLYLLGLAQNFGEVHPQDAVLVFVFLIMAFSRCGDSWSVDHLLRKARQDNGGFKETAVLNGEYTWPVRMIWVFISLIFFASGLAKMRHSGLVWITSDNMALSLVWHQYHNSGADPLTSWGFYLARSTWLPQLLAASTVILELGYPIALFSSTARWFFVPGSVLMLFGIVMVLGPRFYPTMFCQLFWVPWDRVAAWLQARHGNVNRYTVVFDGGCGLCRRTVAVLGSLDLLGRIDFLDAVKQWPEVEKRFPRLRQDQCLTEMHVVTSRDQVATGFDAYRSLAWVLPLGWLALPGLYLPGVRAVGSKIYRAIASSRHRGTCPLPVSTPPAEMRVPKKLEARATRQRD